jgi:hypothetical protein
VRRESPGRKIPSERAVRRISSGRAEGAVGRIVLPSPSASQQQPRATTAPSNARRRLRCTHPHVVGPNFASMFALFSLAASKLLLVLADVVIW